MNAALASLSSEQLRRAVAIKEQIEALEKELNAILSGASAPAAPAAGAAATGGRRGRPPRAAGAVVQAASAAPTPPAASAAAAPARRKRRTISPEGKRRIIEAQRKRWAEWRAARAKAQKAQQK